MEIHGTRAIIICAGEASRWGNYLNTPKHLIEIEGEKILHRTVRLLRERGIEDIYVIVRDIEDRYAVTGSIQAKAWLNPDNLDADKFLSSKHLWNVRGRTLVFYGDCYFTEKAMDTILNYKKEQWTLFCRSTASEITGTKWGECFAQSFYTQHIFEHQEALYRIRELKRKGVIKRCGGWEHYRAMLKRPDYRMNIHKMGKRFIEINDWTDDFDYPEDYETWIQRRAAYLQEGQ